MKNFGNDLVFNVRGDFELGDSGDLHDTVTADRQTPGFSVKQFITNRLVAARNDWPNAPYLGVGLNAYIGRPIAPNILRDIEVQIQQILTIDGFLLPEEVVVKVLDIGAGSEAIMILIFVTNVSAQAIVTFAFDFQRGGFTQVK